MNPLGDLLATGEPGFTEAWNSLDGHIRAITRIAAVASEFWAAVRRPRSHKIPGYTPGHVHLLDDRALMTCDGGLLADSSLFRRPDTGHRSSPFFKTTLRLHTIVSAQARHDQWAADEHNGSIVTVRAEGTSRRAGRSSTTSHLRTLPSRGRTPDGQATDFTAHTAAAAD